MFENTSYLTSRKLILQNKFIKNYIISSKNICVLEIEKLKYENIFVDVNSLN